MTKIILKKVIIGLTVMLVARFIEKLSETNTIKK